MPDSEETKYTFRDFEMARDYLVTEFDELHDDQAKAGTSELVVEYLLAHDYLNEAFFRDVL